MLTVVADRSLDGGMNKSIKIKRKFYFIKILDYN